MNFNLLFLGMIIFSELQIGKFCRGISLNVFNIKISKEDKLRDISKYTSFEKN